MNRNKQLEDMMKAQDALNMIAEVIRVLTPEQRAIVFSGVMALQMQEYARKAGVR
jgi:uncharacterized protein Smg (DUF494 family)